MKDEEPIGTRGVPGRGNRGTTPSAASRSLGGHRRRHLRAVDDDEQHDPTGPQPSQASETQGPGIPLEELLTALIDAADRVLGADWENRIAQRLATLRLRLSGEYEIDDFGLDPELTRSMATAFEPIAEKWFRLQGRGIENVPYDGGALLVANHSGTVPVDGHGARIDRKSTRLNSSHVSIA